MSEKAPLKRVYVVGNDDHYYRHETTHKVLTKVIEQQLEQTLNDLAKQDFDIDEVTETGKNQNGAPIFRIRAHHDAQLELAEVSPEGKVVLQGYDLEKSDKEKANKLAEKTTAASKESKHADAETQGV